MDFRGGRDRGGQGWGLNPDFAAESTFRRLDENQDGVLNYERSDVHQTSAPASS